MSFMCFLKMFSDLCIFLSASAFFAENRRGIGPVYLLLAAGLALLFTLSSLAEKKGWLRFLPLTGLSFLLLLPGPGLLGLILWGICAGYLFFCVWRGAFRPDWDGQTHIFSYYWKIWLIVFFFFCLLNWEKALSLALPLGTAALSGCILLNRSLRHEPAVRGSWRFQLVNGGALAGVAIVSWGITSPGALRLLKEGLKWFYRHLIQPVLTAFVTVVLAILKGLGDLLRRAGVKQPEPVSTDSVFESGVAGTDIKDLVQPGQAFDTTVLKAMLIILLALAVSFLLWKLSMGLKKKRQQAPQTVMTQRSKLQEEPREEPPRGSMKRIRDLYRRYLKLYQEQDIPLAISDTSAEVEKKGRGHFDPEAMAGLREIYIQARYNKQAEPRDAEAARIFYGKLKK